MTDVPLSNPAAATIPGAAAAAPTNGSARLWLYLVRGLVALAWAAAFSAVADSLTAGVATLLVAYPVIDVIASLIDAHAGSGAPTQRLQRFNAATSTAAAIGLAIAATGTVADVLHVFAAWAIVSGVAQVVVALRSRTRATGSLWPMLVAGGLSTLVGVFYYLSDPTLDNLVIYATGGGVWFVLQAGLLGRHRRTLLDD
jgi:uncharacterized membrane protein HdeD (DUF308 family)